MIYGCFGSPHWIQKPSADSSCWSMAILWRTLEMMRFRWVWSAQVDIRNEDDVIYFGCLT